MTLLSGGPNCKYQINILQTRGDAIWILKKSAGVSVVPFYFALSKAERDPVA